jgi:Kef-type K+ transport system membrane component KefB
MAEGAPALLQLFLVFAAAKAAAEVFERLRQPAVVGELLVGVLLGPSVLGWVRPGSMLDALAGVGVIVLLFAVGLETKASDLFRVGRTALAVAAVGVALPFALGFGFLLWMHQPPTVAMFVGAALVATSVGITARVLSDAGLISTRSARVILAAAVIDDILGLIVLALVTGVAEGGVDVRHIASILAATVAFVAFQVLVAPRLVARHGHHLARLRITRAPLVVALTVLLGLSALSDWLGLAAIVGAFFAGMAFAEAGEGWSLEAQTRPIADFLVPFFFVVVGMRVDVRLLADASVLVPGAVLAVLAVLSKVVGCGVGALGEGRRDALAIGVGMVPRGEVGLIVASAGLASGLLPSAVYAMIVAVAIVTTLAVPPIIPAVFRWAAAEA